jgi:hypothetical protein
MLQFRTKLPATIQQHTESIFIFSQLVVDFVAKLFTTEFNKAIDNWLAQMRGSTAAATEEYNEDVVVDEVARSDGNGNQSTSNEPRTNDGVNSSQQRSTQQRSPDVLWLGCVMCC